MLRLFIYTALFFIPALIFGQDIEVNQKNSHGLFVEILNNSKDLKYNEVLQAYDKYIEHHPNDITVKLYRCKFIGSAYYDEYDDYNLKFEETDECIESLYNSYPTNAEVLLYKLENTYGELREDLLIKIDSIYTSNTSKWNDNQISRLFEIKANNYSEKDNNKIISYAQKAQKHNDSLDLSVLISKTFLKLNNKEKARDILLSSLEKESETWVLNQKGELLVELDEHEEALKMFERVNEKDSTFTSNESLYEIFLEKEQYDKARKYLIKDTLNNWNKVEAIQKLANHDLHFSDSKIALESLRRMQRENYFDDFFGIKRLKLSFKNPIAAWSFIEITHLIILLILIGVLFVMPYLWILPIFGASKYFNFKVKSKVTMPVNWTLKHFWLVSFIYLLCQVLIVFIFYYQDYINYYFDIGYSFVEEDIIENQTVLANSLIIFSSFLFVTILFFLNEKRFKFTLSSKLSIAQIIGFSFLFLIFNSILLRVLGSFIDFSEPVNLIQSLNARPEIVALLNEYGFFISFFIVALIVPFYEEIIFRGIILSSTEKHLGFLKANIVQASLFAIIHFNLGLFIFYFVFGIITGYTAKKTNGLLTGIVFHAVNNFFVLLLLNMTSKLLM